MIALPVTSLFTAVFAVALVALSLPVSLRRIKVGDLIGDSSDQVLHLRIRAQGNFTEYVPLGLIGLGLVEAQGGSVWLVLAIGGVLAGGRLLHAIGMFRASTPVRGIGIFLTYVALLSEAARLLLHLTS